MQWNGETGGGFTTGRPWQALNSNFTDYTVALQDGDPNSLLSHYRSLIQLRNQYPALRTGDYLPFTSSCRQVYPILRVEGDQALLVLTNLSRQELENCSISIEASPLQGEYTLTSLFGDGDFAPITFGADGSVTEYPLPEVLAPWEGFVFEISK
jgi:glycosidase